MEAVGRRRFQFSLRTILIATAVLACLLAPVTWVARERQQMLRAQTEILLAREVALRSVILEARERSEAARQEALAAEARSIANREALAEERPTAVERLMRENTALKQEVESLRHEVERLKKTSTSRETPN
jgi:hypothetical protein